MNNEKLAGFEADLSVEKRYPVSAYRLQFNANFTFRDAAGLVPYLHELGITDCYSSPYFKARRGSQHGYDISDHNALNPEVGTEGEYRDFVDQLQRNSMGQILDVVPNHMSIFDNPKWQDVLENGPSSIYARFFDIDWKPAKAELHRRVLLPILKDLYGAVLEQGKIALNYEGGAFYIGYQNHRLPVGPRTAVPVLESSLRLLRGNLAESHPDFLELQSIITASKNLPEQRETEPEKVKERHREKEIIKKRLAELCNNGDKVLGAVLETVKVINGTAGDSQSFARLHELLEQQGYRLSFWRVAGEEINYRRFFDINELVALRMEDPAVFEEIHRLVIELFSKGMITGMRIDHVDGLFDPGEYLHRLQRDCWVESVVEKLKHEPRLSEIDPTTLRKNLIQKFNDSLQGKSATASRPVYIVVEKILGEHEEINKDWPVAGTTGYEFAAELNRVFVDSRQSCKMRDVYCAFTGLNSPFDDIAYYSKDLVMKTTMVGEVNLLAHQLNSVSERSWQFRDFTLNSLRDAIREVIACFPVYRTYINSYAGSISENDEAVIDRAITDAKKRNPAVSGAVFDFVKGVLLLQYPTGMSESGREEQRLFVMRFQQFTGPVMAKGVEDTAFYIYNPLISLNEVGGSPNRSGTSVREFHSHNIARLRNKPHSLISTSTHDSKRGEDIRARINVLSEIPREWRAALVRWSWLNRIKKLELNGEPVPDMNEEYFLYQTLIGTYPLDGTACGDITSYTRRIKDYMLKALREAKVHTSWISPNAVYEENTMCFVEQILDRSLAKKFLEDFERLNRSVSALGMYNSLSQAVLKIFSPGVPDIYQGNELWAFNLTDPDNRGPVDYELRSRVLGELEGQIANGKGLDELVKDLLDTINDGRIKLYVTWKSLNYRKDSKALFDGAYHPLKVLGHKRDHVCVFAWKNGGKQLVVVVPRFLAAITRRATIRPLGEHVWEDTRIVLSPKLIGSGFKNIFTGELVETVAQNSRSVLPLCKVFKSFPVAALELK